MEERTAMRGPPRKDIEKPRLGFQVEPGLQTTISLTEKDLVVWQPYRMMVEMATAARVDTRIAPALLKAAA